MKRSQILELVFQAFESRPNPGPHRFRLFWHPNGYIACEPCYFPQRELVFYTLNNSTIENGLSDREWTAIESKIFSVLHQKGLV